MRIICHMNTYPTVIPIILVWAIWGLIELNGQMNPSLFQPFRVVSTLTISSFALEAGEECTGHENPRFLQKQWTWDRISARCPTINNAFAFFSPLDDLEYRYWTKRITLSYNHALLRIPPKIHLPCILQRFSYTLLHDCIYSSYKLNS